MDNRRELISPFFRKVELRDTLSPEERDAILRASDDVRVVSAGHDIVREGDRPSHSTLLARGLSARFSITQDGARQITALHLDGDFVDLHSFLLKTMDHGVRALTDCVVISFPHARLRTITEQQPHLTRLLWLNTLLDAALHREWLVAKGQLSSLEHMAHLICELQVRFEVAGRADKGGFTLAMTQADLADAMGISTVHANRTLQELRSTRLLEWENGIVQIHDVAALRRLGQFDDNYLHLRREPR